VYLPKRAPVEYPAGALVNGRCLEEAETVMVNVCSPGVSCLFPCPVYAPCDEVNPSPETEKLCEIAEGQTSILACLEIIKNQ